MELESKNYTILHLHSMLSNAVTNIDSVTAYSEYIQKAHDLGMSAMAFSEHGSVMGWVKKKLQMEELGMKYIHAEEFYLTQSLEEKIRDRFKFLPFAPIVFISAKYRNRINTLYPVINLTSHRQCFQQWYRRRGIRPAGRYRFCGEGPAGQIR